MQMQVSGIELKEAYYSELKKLIDPLVDKRYSIREIAEWLNDNTESTSPRGKRWDKENLKHVLKKIDVRTSGKPGI